MWGTLASIAASLLGLPSLIAQYFARRQGREDQQLADLKEAQHDDVLAANTRADVKRLSDSALDAELRTGSKP